jgi:Protein of unknown function (DUF3263)
MLTIPFVRLCVLSDAPRSAMQPAKPPESSSEDHQEPQVPAPRQETPPAELTEREEQILAFESKWWRHAGAKEQAIRDTFGLSSTRYYQILNGLLDNPAALEHDPVLVGRLRRLRSTRARTRRR